MSAAFTPARVTLQPSSLGVALAFSVVLLVDSGIGICGGAQAGTDSWQVSCRRQGDSVTGAQNDESVRLIRAFNSSTVELFELLQVCVSLTYLPTHWQ